MAKSPLGVLILHGFTASPDHLLELHTCIQDLGLPTRVPVLRGHGARSPEALRGVSWCDWVADAEVALQALLTTSERAVIVGHCMGGLVYPHHFWLAPTAWGTSPPPGMALTGLFIKISTLFANCYRLAVMPLLGRHKFDAAMAVLMVVPINKGGNPFADLA